MADGTPTAALFAAICNTLAVPGDWVLPNPNIPTSYTAVFVDQNGLQVVETFPIRNQLQQQMRLRSMTGNALDNAAVDFYGQALPRNPGEGDASYLSRIVGGLFVPRITRPNVFSYLTSYTGIPPHLIDPNVPADVGAWSSATGGIITNGSGKKVFASLDSATPFNGIPGALDPPCFYGIDNGRAPFRWVTPNGVPTDSMGNPLHVSGFAYQVFIVTTYPLGYGAQGNAVHGYGTITGSNPPRYTSPSFTPGSPSVFTNVSGSTYTSASTIGTVNGKQVFTNPNGDPTSAWFNSRGLTPSDLAIGRAQVLSAVDRLRAGGFTFWVSVIPAETLVALGFTS